VEEAETGLIDSDYTVGEVFYYVRREIRDEEYLLTDTTSIRAIPTAMLSLSFEILKLMLLQVYRLS
jgi:hypothetical protein